MQIPLFLIRRRVREGSVLRFLACKTDDLAMPSSHVWRRGKLSAWVLRGTWHAVLCTRWSLCCVRAAGSVRTRRRKNCSHALLCVSTRYIHTARSLSRLALRRYHFPFQRGQRTLYPCYALELASIPPASMFMSIPGQRDPCLSWSGASSAYLLHLLYSSTTT